MLKASKQFRGVNGHLHLRSLRDTLNESPKPSVPSVKMRRQRHLMITGPPPKFHGARDILSRRMLPAVARAPSTCVMGPA